MAKWIVLALMGFVVACNGQNATIKNNDKNAKASIVEMPSELDKPAGKPNQTPSAEQLLEGQKQLDSQLDKTKNPSEPETHPKAKIPPAPALEDVSKGQ